MTWRDEPLTKGEFVDALTDALQRNKKGEEHVLEMYKGMAKNSPALYQFMRLLFRCDETTLESLRDHIQVEGAIQDAPEDSDVEERRGDGGVPGADGA